MYDLNMLVPDLTSSVYTSENKFRLIKNYLTELNDVLSYALTDKTVGEISAISQRVSKNEQDNAERVRQLSVQSVSRFNTLKEQILRTAEDIERDYRVYVENKGNELLQSVEGSFVASSDFGEYRNVTDTALKQNADNIQLMAESVDSVSGDLEAFKESARSEISIQADSITSMLEQTYATKGETE